MRKPELSIALIQVLRRAAWQARALGHSYVGTEHFLLSLLTAERAGGVLRSLGWEESTLRSVLLLERGRGSRAVPLVQAYSPLARSAIGAAAHEAAALRAADVRPEHLLLSGSEDNAIRGTVDVSEMMGSAVHLHVSACGRDTIMIVPTTEIESSAAFTIGSPIAFTF